MTSSLGTPSLAPLVLVDGSFKMKTSGQNSPRRLKQPEYRFDWSPFSQVTFELVIANLNGATAFSMTPRLMYGQTHTTGNFWRNSTWAYPDATQVGFDCVEGSSFFGTITGTGFWKRTVRNFPMLMAIDLGEDGGPNPLTYTGGSGITMSLLAYPTAK